MDEKHAPTSAHNHNHDHTHTREVVNRLARAIGHLQKVKQMVEDGEDCSQVLVQLAAVKSALNSTGKVILKDHLSTVSFTPWRTAIRKCSPNYPTPSTGL